MQIQAIEGLNLHLQKSETSYTILELLLGKSKSRKNKDGNIEELKRQLREEKRILATIIRKARNLRKRIDLEIEMALAKSDESFQKGEAIEVIYTDVNESFNSIRTKIKYLSQYIGSARNTMTAAYDSENQEFSDTAQREIDKAFRSAEAVEDEEQIFNSLTRNHNTLVRGTPYHEISLPQLKLGSYYRQLIQEQEGSGIAEAQKTFDEMIISLNKIKSGINTAENHHKAKTESYIRDIYRGLN